LAAKIFALYAMTRKGKRDHIATWRKESVHGATLETIRNVFRLPTQEDGEA
jgi:hypothetical protein